jgi:hypothetical protein
MASQTTTAYADFPYSQGVIGATAVAVGTDIYLTGDNYRRDTMYIYDTLTDTWRAGGAITAMQPLYNGIALVHMGNYIYGVGGWTGSINGANNAVKRYNLTTDTWGGGLAAYPTNVMGAATFALNDDVFLCFGGTYPGGGAQYDYGLAGVYAYSISGNAWDTTTYTACPTDGGFSSTARFGNYIYFVNRYHGPAQGGPTYWTVAEIYNLATDTWEIGQAPSTYINGPTGNYLGNIFILNSVDAVNTTFIFISSQSGARVYAQIIG